MAEHSDPVNPSLMIQAAMEQHDYRKEREEDLIKALKTIAKTILTLHTFNSFEEYYVLEPEADRMIRCARNVLNKHNLLTPIQNSEKKESV